MSVSPFISDDTKDKSPDQLATNQWSDNLNLVEGRAYFLSLANKQDPKALSKLAKRRQVEVSWGLEVNTVQLEFCLKSAAGAVETQAGKTFK